MMRIFHATAYNEKGFTFSFHFHNENWNGIKEAATNELLKIVSKDKLHMKNGPWKIRNIDIG